jgi:hypothetical protein
MSVYFGKHISPNKFWDGKQLDMQELNKSISAELKQLTTHIESILDHEISLKKLNDLKVDYTLPEVVNDCLQNDFSNPGNKLKEPSGLYSFFIFLIKIFYFLPYLIWRKVTFPKIAEDEFIGTFRYVFIITLAPIYLLLLVLVAFLVLGKTIGTTLLGIGIILPLIALRVK